MVVKISPSAPSPGTEPSHAAVLEAVPRRGIEDARPHRVRRGRRLDWTTTNLNSKWRGIHAANTRAGSEGAYGKQHQDGTVYLSTPDSKVMGGYDLTNLGQETPFGKATLPRHS